MSKFRYVLIFGVLCLSACSTTPEFDRSFGTSVDNIYKQQVLNENAGLENRHQKVEGIDAQAASRSVEEYYKSFSKPEKKSQPVFLFGVDK